MRLRDWIVALLALLGGRHRRRDGGGDGEDRPERLVEDADRRPRAELAVIVLLLLTGVAGAGFVVAYGLGASTQVLGGVLAATFALLAAALIVTSRHLVVSEEIEEDYPEPDPEEAAAVARIVRESGSRLTRKKMLAAAAGAAGTGVGAALVAPAASLGPLFDSSELYRTPWRRGRRLVDADGEPLRADEVARDAFYTAYPEGADHKDLGAPLVVVRLDPGELALPPDRRDWAPDGILAFSKICTHAGCAVAEYRTPKFDPTQPRPALVCPCHYSTFDPARGAEVMFGPAGRPLPQLPLLVDDAGLLRAAGNYSGPVGPSWSGVRSGEPRT